jgi:hypothetical protein
LTLWQPHRRFQRVEWKLLLQRRCQDTVLKSGLTANFSGPCPSHKLCSPLAFIHNYLIERNAAVANDYRDLLVRRYGQDQGSQIKYAEAFELCQYGAQPSAAELDELFPM